MENMTRDTADHSKEPKLIDVDMWLYNQRSSKDHYKYVRSAFRKLLQIEKSFLMMGMLNCNLMIRMYEGEQLTDSSREWRRVSVCSRLLRGILSPALALSRIWP